MGVHSTLFGPVKYSILPQHLRDEELVGGNALVEMGTFVAILLGTILGGVLVACRTCGTDARRPRSSSALAVAGWLASRGVPLAPAADARPAHRLEPDHRDAAARSASRAQNRTVFLSILGISWFWFYGALSLAQFPGLGREVLGGDEHVVTLLLAVFSVGIGLGWLLCERLSGGKIELGLVPLGSIGLTLFALDLFWATRAAHAARRPASASRELPRRAARHWRVALDLVADRRLRRLLHRAACSRSCSTAASRSTALAHHRRQQHPERRLHGARRRRSVIALRAAGLTIPQLFLVTAVLNAAVAVYIYTLMPEFLMRFIIWLLVHTVYRVKQRGLEHVPEEGRGRTGLQPRELRRRAGDRGGLSAADPLRHGSRDLPDPGPELRLPHRPRHPDRVARRRTRRSRSGRSTRSRARSTHGELVCIFPEGQITTHRRAEPVPPGRRAHRRAHAGAGRADGAPRPVGQLLQPEGRPGDAPAVSPHMVAHRADLRPAGARGRGHRRRPAGERARAPRRLPLRPTPAKDHSR